MHDLLDLSVSAQSERSKYHKPVDISQYTFLVIASQLHGSEAEGAIMIQTYVVVT